jgi:hypothetical protein
MNINLNCSKAQFSLLKYRDDNFADNILKYLYLPLDKTNCTLQTHIIIYNYLIEFSSNLFKKFDNWKQQHRLIFEIDGLFRTYFYFLESPNNSNIIINDDFKEIAKNTYKYIHSFWSESYGIDWTKLNNVLMKSDILSKNTIKQTNGCGHIYNIMQYSSDNNITTYNLPL